MAAQATTSSEDKAAWHAGFHTQCHAACTPMHTAAAGALGAPDEPSLGPRRELIVLRRRAPAYGAWKMVGY